jgi:hypothetical protein
MRSNTAQLTITVTLVLLACSASSAQRGTAEQGYYPPGYRGDTFTGVVTAVDDATREITLTYEGKKKTETFTGVLREGYSMKMKDGSTREIKVSDIPLGTRWKTYSMARTRGKGKERVKYYEIFRLVLMPQEQGR